MVPICYIRLLFVLSFNKTNKFETYLSLSYGMRPQTTLKTSTANFPDFSGLIRINFAIIKLYVQLF